MNQATISAIILAGGQGRRFHYADKGWVEWQQRPMIERVLDAIGTQVDDIVISCNRNIERYKTLGYTTCQDSLADFQGPLAGIQSALSLVKHPLCLVCPCDMPLLPQNLVSRLLVAKQEASADIAFVDDGRRQQYLVALLNTQLQAKLNRYLETGQRSVHGWYQQLETISVSFEDQTESFFNINSPTETP